MFQIRFQNRFLIMFLLMVVFALAGNASASEKSGWSFSEQSETVGLDYVHEFDADVWNKEWHYIGGGLGIGDINGDGWDDIYAVTGDGSLNGVPNVNPNKLFIANQDGTYTESALTWGLFTSDQNSAGPLIVDINHDGFNDLLVGGVRGEESDTPGQLRVYLHNGAAAFTDGTPGSGLMPLIDRVRNHGFAAGDLDRDGDLDLLVAHWNELEQPILFENNGSGVFSDISETRMSGVEPGYIFTPTFAYLNNDLWPDLSLTSDFLRFDDFGGGSRYFLNDQTGFMIQQPQDPLTDENGMGGAVADYDNDGDLDWFASSIWDSDGVNEGNWGVSGNRLYANDGNGQFTDVTDAAGVRVGFWGWGACFADFNNDMHLDLFHVNGFPASLFDNEDEFDFDPARMFINNGDATFTEMSESLGVADTGQGRAILCFDNDRDGDIDILVNNNLGPSRFFENELISDNHWLQIKLSQPLPNHEAIGAVIRVTAGGVTQMRQLMAGGNFSSSHPTAQHFGLGDNSYASAITITWPDGTVNVHANVPADQYLIIEKSNRILNLGFE